MGKENWMAVRKMDYGECINHFKQNETVRSLLRIGNLDLHKTPYISIVIPTYNRLDLLQEAIASAVNQKDVNFDYEIIIVDNSQDEFEHSKKQKMIEEFACDRIYYYQNEINIGGFGNWNRCIELARGNWIAMLHDDDLLKTNYLELIQNIINRNHISIEKVAYIKAENAPLESASVEDSKQSFLKRLLINIGRNKLIRYTTRDCAILDPTAIGILGAPTCGTLLNRQAFLQSGGYHQDHWPSGDAYLPVQLILQNKYRVYCSVAPLGYYRWEENASLKRETVIGFIEEYVCYRKYYAKYDKLSAYNYRHYMNVINRIEYDLMVQLAKKSGICDEDFLQLIRNMIGPISDYNMKYHWYRNYKIAHYRIKKIWSIIF